MTPKEELLDQSENNLSFKGNITPMPVISGFLNKFSELHSDEDIAIPSYIWNYIKKKIASVLGLTETGYNGKALYAGNADTVNNLTVQTDVPLNAVFTDTQSDWNATTGKASILNKPYLGEAASVGVDTIIAAGSDSANLPTSMAVAKFVESKGYKTTDNNTTYTFSTGDSNGQIKVTSSEGTAQNISVKGLGSLAYSNATIPTVIDTYDATSSSAMSGKAVASAISELKSDLRITDDENNEYRLSVKNGKLAFELITQ